MFCESGSRDEVLLLQTRRDSAGGLMEEQQEEHWKSLVSGTVSYPKRRLDRGIMRRPREEV